ncbi:MAG: hypothetical protein PVH33_14970 [Syntrophobacterales bacterium]
MKRILSSVGLVGLVTLLAIVLAATPLVFAKGEGSFVIKAENGNTYRFGGQLRMIPTSENNWDFGLGTVVVTTPTGPGTSVEVTRRNFKEHVNEAGNVAQGYIRTEARLYFNAEDSEGKWDFYSALEFDSVVDQTEVDQRGRDYGLERVHGSVAIPGLEQVRFHAGWDIYFLDAVDAGAGFLYGDDDPGFWLTGDFDSIEFKVGYHKKFENNFASRDEVDYLEKEAGIESDNDRDIYSAMLTYNIDDDNEVRFMGLYDRMNTRSESEIDSPLTGDPLTEQKGADVDTYRLGLLYTGKLGIIEPEFEIAYQGGEAKDITTEFDGTLDDQDIEAYALYGDVALNLTDVFGFKVIPHVGFMYTSGDDDPDDDNLEGYVGVANAQRFTPRFGGEDTIIGDTNVVLGTLLYGYLPEFYGNLGGTQQGGVATGGLANGSLGGRGDNPGLTMFGGGITIEPREFISYRTNFMWFEYNEDFSVVNPNNPTGTPPAALFGPANIEIDSGTLGQQWSNSLRISLNRHVHIFGNATFFFPGEVVEDVTEALGNENDKVAQRYAVALIWRF